MLTVAVKETGPVEQRLASAFEAAHPGVSVRLLETAALPPPAGEAVAADVWWGADAFAMAAAAGDGRLAPLPPAAPPSPHARWLPVERIHPVLAFNVDSVSRGAAPRDVRVLFHPLWRGRLLLPDPAGSALGRALVGWAMDAERVRTGDETAGVDWLRRLDASVVAYVPEREIMRALAAGRGTVAVADLRDAARARADGLPVDYVALEGGPPPITRGMAMLPEADTALAGAFMALAAGEPGRSLLVAEYRLPADGAGGEGRSGGDGRAGAEAGEGREGGAGVAEAPDGGAEPSWAREARQRLPVAPIRVDTVAAHLDRWLGRWRVEARGRGAPGTMNRHREE
ncbi:MAG: ABC transporter substrate-binding protein [Gemmatimonadetes bacterium]|nr:ABC transporter substrate-binding protein [Gemmatimonadota bacterium]